MQKNVSQKNLNSSGIAQLRVQSGPGSAKKSSQNSTMVSQRYMGAQQ